MKERPILMSAPMVRATINWSKHQTRRVVKPQPETVRDMFPTTPETTMPDGGSCNRVFKVTKSQGIYRCLGMQNFVEEFSPYGQPGDRLWVREKFQPLFADGIENHWETDWKTGNGYSISYPATDGVQEFFNLDDELSSSCKPSIHMPRWASRINLEITGVRVERLQDISEADAIAEGVEPITYTGENAGPNKFSILLDGCWFNAPTAVEVYRILWESINGEGSWATNPWVWVVEFKRVME